MLRLVEARESPSTVLTLKTRRSILGSDGLTKSECSLSHPEVMKDLRPKDEDYEL